MASSRNVMAVLAVVTVVAVVATVPPVDAVISCGQVFVSLSPCVNYLRRGGTLPAPCCAGVSNLAAAARSTADRQTVCGCLKTAASSVTGVDLSRAAGLPSHCGVKIPYKINPNADCAKVR